MVRNATPDQTNLEGPLLTLVQGKARTESATLCGRAFLFDWWR